MRQIVTTIEGRFPAEFGFSVRFCLQAMRLVRRPIGFLGLLFVLLIGLSGCSAIGPNLEQPTLKVTSISLGESTPLSQSFRIGLLVTNPNDVDLPVKGMNYALSLNGQKIVTGANNQIPALVAYSDTPITIEATADLLSVVRLLTSLNTDSDTLKYQLSGKLGLSGWRLPIHINQTGDVALTQ